MQSSHLKEIISVIKYPLLFLALCWVLFYTDAYFELDYFRYGVSPRKTEGLIGILACPFIHGDFNHIANNSLPIFILSSLIFYFYKPIAWSAIFWIYIVSGLWLWIGGRNSDVITNYHFGASTLIYGFSTFLFCSGVFRKHTQLMVVSALVVFLYGSITHGIFPFDTKISWEGHLFGALSGVLVAFQYRKDGPQKPVQVWPEQEIDLEKMYNESLIEESMLESESSTENSDVENNQTSPSLDPFNIIYHYKPTEQPLPNKKEG